MESIPAVLRMNGGQEETSYAKNSSLQRHVISLVGSIIIREAVAKCLNKKTLTTTTMTTGLGIADLGCSSGPNTLIATSMIIEAVVEKCAQVGIIPVPEMKVSLNDLPGNDFNNVFMSLPEFYSRMEREKGIRGCFVSCVGGSFYGRLFPANSQHLIHSSSSLHWLSQVPRGLDENVGGGKHSNKGKIYISKTSPPGVATAYLHQFQQDFFQFLRFRAQEMVPGGQMVLSFFGRDPSAATGSHEWELLAQALMSMASQGLVEEEKIDAFNIPFYAPCAQQVESIISKEGSFLMDRVEECVVRWDVGFRDDALFDDHQLGKLLSKGQHFSKLIRAVVESMLQSTFGAQIMDELFRRYAELVDDYFAQTTPKHINLVISLAKI